MKRNSPNQPMTRILALASAAFFAVLFMANPVLADDIRNFGEFFSIFDPSLGGEIDDMSVSWLRMTFGDPIRDEEATTLIGFALGRLNAAVLAIGSMVLTYKIVVGIMQTAHDGSILGRRWSTLWGPTRVAIGAAALVPLASGLCLAQALVLLIASMGVGLANHAWEISLEGVLTHGKPLVAPRASSKMDVAVALFDVALCTQVTNAIYRERAENAAGTPMAAAFPAIDPAIDLREPISLQIRDEGRDNYENTYLGANWMKTPVGAHPDIGSRGRASGSYGDMCGSIKMPGGLSGSFAEFGELTINRPFWPWGSATAEVEDGAQTDLHRLRLQAIRDGTSVTHGSALIGMMSAMSEAAQPIALTVVNGSVEVQPARPTDIIQAVREYDAAVSGAVADVFNQLEGTAVAELRGMALTDGWVNVGAWYQQIAGFNASISQIASSKPEVTPPRWGDVRRFLGMDSSRGGATDPLAAAMIHRDALVAAVRIEGYSADDVRNSSDLQTFQPLESLEVPDPGSDVGAFVRGLWDILGSMVSGLADLVGIDLSVEGVRGSLQDGIDVRNRTDAGNPLGIIQRTGLSLEDWAFGMILGGTVVNALSQTLLSRVPGAGVADKAATFIAGVGVFLLIPALIMGYLLPMMPWVLWISALIGWFILVCEAVIAAPLWALSHMRMDGEGLAGPLGEKGYFLLLSMLLRPVLMVIGFILGMVMFNIFAGATAAGFDMATAANYGTSQAGLIGTVFLFAILAGMYVWMAYKSFSLIHIVPDRILRWIGQGGEGLGEQEGMDQTKIIAMAAMHQMSGGMGSMVKGVSGARFGAQKGAGAALSGKGSARDGGGGMKDVASRGASKMVGDRRSTRQDQGNK
ncbi:MAG: DotA/TraY family protein [Alphaproteobacteria bacterium]